MTFTLTIIQGVPQVAQVLGAGSGRRPLRITSRKNNVLVARHLSYCLVLHGYQLRTSKIVFWLLPATAVPISVCVCLSVSLPLSIYQYIYSV